MQTYEYRAVPAPTRASKVKGVKDPAERYAHAVSELMNTMAAEGWEYWRTEALPCTERRGLTGSATVYHNLMVFRRPTADFMAAQLSTAVAAPPPAPEAVPQPVPEPQPSAAGTAQTDAAATPDPAQLDETDHDDGAPTPDRARPLTAARPGVERGAVPPLTLRRAQQTGHATDDDDPSRT